MSKLGRRLIKSAEEAVAIAEGRMEPARRIEGLGKAKPKARKSVSAATAATSPGKGKRK